MNTFCTIITGNYYAYALALFDSLKQTSTSSVQLAVFISDTSVDKSFFKDLEKENQGLSFYFPDEINSDKHEALKNKYQTTYMSGYRWSLKPLFINHLIINNNFEKVIFLDGDLFFYNSPDFIFDLLDQYRVLLTPHWRCADNPEEDIVNFNLNFQGGIYNAGFIAVSKNATEIMDFWTNLCLTECKIDFEQGMYADQKYLDILHSRFEGVGVLRHRGCNVATWNFVDNKRSLNENGEVLINNNYPIVFIHFTSGTMKGIINGTDALLLHHFIAYSNAVNKYNPNINLIEKTKCDLLDLEQKNIENKPKMDLITQMRYNLKLRTRINNLFSKNN